MTQVNEIAPDVYRISIHMPEIDLQFNHFLIRDDQPLLYHTGMRKMFPQVLEAVATLIKPDRLRWIGFSHFEVDECGALNDWLQAAPEAQPVHGFVGALVNLGDFSSRPIKMLAADELLITGRYRFRFQPTPHLPHGWDAGMLFEETNRTLFCSDLFHQIGNVQPVTETDILDRVGEALRQYQAGPLMDYLPYHTRTRRLLKELSAFQPRTLAIMHGSSYAGDCGRAILDLGEVMRQVLGANHEH